MRSRSISQTTAAAAVDDYRWLIGDEAGDLLLDLAAAEASTLSQAERLRKNWSAERVHLLLEQVELRQRARAKFRHADRLFFTAAGLEQATDEVVATYKAARYCAAQPVADLCCGIGGDLISLARCGAVRGIDRHPVHALIAQANLDRSTQLQFSEKAPAGSVICADSRSISPDDFAAWHIDPDRRAQGHRTLLLEEFEPGMDEIERWRKSLPAGAMKLAPATEIPEAWQAEAQREWISHRGECRQQVLWFGPLSQATSGRRVATLLDTNPVRQVVGDHDDAAATDELPCLEEARIPARPGHDPWHAGQYLYEPDSAVLAARLSGALARQHGLLALGPTIPYLVGEALVVDPALRGFEIHEVLPLDQKRLRQVLRQRKIGRVEVKKRGVALDPAQWQRQLSDRSLGDEVATLLIAPAGRRTMVWLTRRIASGAKQ